MRRPDLAVVLLGLATCTGPACGPARPDSAATPYRDPAHGFAVRVPAGWSARDTSYVLNSHQAVFLTVVNRAAGAVVLHDSTIARSDGQGYSVGCGPEVMRRQLPRGAVVVLYAHFVGGFPPTSQYVEDGVGSSLAALLDTLPAVWQLRDGVATCPVSFVKWGEAWNLAAYAHGEPTRADRRAVEALLRSTTFPPRPIAYRQQAIEIAFAQLPDSIRAVGFPSAPGDTPAHPELGRPGGRTIERGGDLLRVTFQGGPGARRTEVVRRDSLYIVTFRIGEDPAQPPARAWTYAVAPSGAVQTLARP